MVIWTKVEPITFCDLGKFINFTFVMHMYVFCIP